MDWKKTGMEVVHADAADESLRMQTLDGLNCGFSIHLWLQGGLAAPVKFRSECYCWAGAGG